MIGEKIIGKILTDNLNDFQNDDQKDMEPIMKICSIIQKVLSILKDLNVKQRAQIESQVLHRSNILMILFKYVSNTFTVDQFHLDDYTDNNKVLKMIQRDEDYLNLFCFIISKRLMIIDDNEFMEKNTTQMAYPFIPFREIKFVSWILNNISYRIF
jgi:hypothetical protein